MEKVNDKRKFTLIKSAILTGTLIFSMGSIEVNELMIREEIPYTTEDKNNNINFEQELYNIQNEEINIQNEELKKIIEYQLGKETFTKEDLKLIDTLKIDTRLSNNDLSDLKYLPNLTSLIINNNTIDISDIKYNINLYTLSLTNCDISNTNEIPNSINNLVLSDSTIKDNVFNTPYDLTDLYIRNTTYNNIIIKNPSRLLDISINTTSNFDLETIKYCYNLKDISIVQSPNIHNSEILKQFKNTYITLDDYASIWIDKETLSSIEISDETDKLRLNTELEKLDNIIKELNLSEEDEETKIKKITMYVINALDYDKTTDLNSNYNIYPMYFALNSDEGICINYSCLWQALANRAGIKSYQLYSTDHTWNMVNENVYIDPTFIDAGVVLKAEIDGKPQLVNVTDTTVNELFDNDKQNLLYFYELDLDDILDTYHNPSNTYKKLNDKYTELTNIGYVNPNSLARVIVKNQTRIVELKILMATILMLLMEYKGLDKIYEIKHKKEIKIYNRFTNL